jgi:predicted nucleic-acid-binding Zn-ribbon protein
MSSSTCPRCGGKEFRQLDEHTYVDSEELSEVNKNTYKRQLKCVKCDFEFPST